MWRSVPQIAVRFTWILTSLTPGTGSGTSSSHSPRARSRLTKAFIGPSPGPAPRLMDVELVHGVTL